MSQIGVDAHTYALIHSRTYADCLSRCRGDTSEAKRLAQYYMRDWYVVTDGPTCAEINEVGRDQHW